MIPQVPFGRRLNPPPEENNHWAEMDHGAVVSTQKGRGREGEEERERAKEREAVMAAMHQTGRRRRRWTVLFFSAGSLQQ